MEKCGNLWKNGRFSGRTWPDWGNTARADMAGLGSIGLNKTIEPAGGLYTAVIKTWRKFGIDNVIVSISTSCVLMFNSFSVIISNGMVFLI